ncbi:MAG: hypothetical protein ACOC3J_01965 [Gemmatimonadota bacterium]
MFFRRGLSGPDPWLDIKLWIFSIGAILALLGMGFREEWLIGAAAVVLLAGLALRFVRRGDGENGDRTG